MSIRQSYGRLWTSLCGQQRRKLLLLVFLWTCLCLVIFKSSLFASSPLRLSRDSGDEFTSALHLESLEPTEVQLQADKLHAGDDGNSNGDGLMGSSPFTSSSSSWSSPTSSEAPSETVLELAAPPRAAVVAAAAAAAAPVPQAGQAKQSYLKSREDQVKQNSESLYYNVMSSPLSSSSRPQQATSQSDDHKASHGSQMHGPRATHSDELVSGADIAGGQCQYNYPSLFDLQFNNIYWQRFTSRSLAAPPLAPQAAIQTNASDAKSSQSAATFYLYNAYYDDRWRAGLASVRVLAMIDRIHPPPTNCLLWSTSLVGRRQRHKPLVTRAKFLYAWYPKWGNYKDGLLQPWIVTCPIPRAHAGLVPDSVTLVEVPAEMESRREFDLELGTENQLNDEDRKRRRRRDIQQQASIAMPPAFSSSSLSPSAAHVSTSTQEQPFGAGNASVKPKEYDCEKTLPLTNNLPVYNQRPAKKKKFAVCVKGLDFPHEDVSVRLVEWIELLNLLGADKIFLYDLDVHENISRVLHYYKERGMVELSPLTLPGEQPNLPEYQHLYLKNRLTAKRQNELIPYNDCLYRNLNSYQYLALLDIDEIIMPLKHHNWYDLMQQVEELSLSEQNYSRASYNVRNVYFFDDLAGPLGTTSSSSSSRPESAASGGSNDDKVPATKHQPLERGIPNYLHMMQHVYRSKNYTEPGQYVKCFHNTERVVSLHNHFPMNCFGQCTTYSIPTRLAHLQHYRKDCVGPLRQSCKNDFRAFTMRDTTIWKYKQQMIRRTTRVLNHLDRQRRLASAALPAS